MSAHFKPSSHCMVPAAGSDASCRRENASRSIHAVEPSVDFTLGLIPRHAVALLQPADQLGLLAFDHIKVVVGELAPLLLDLAFDFLPIASDTRPSHRSAPSLAAHVRHGRKTLRTKNRSDAATSLTGNGAAPSSQARASKHLSQETRSPRELEARFPKRQGRSRCWSTTPELTGRARGGGNGRPAAKAMHRGPDGSDRPPGQRPTRKKSPYISIY